MKPFITRYNQLGNQFQEVLKRYKPYLWSIVFWTWVVLVSIWIDGIPVSEVPDEEPQEQFSNLQFSEMHFEQRYIDGTHIMVNSSHAVFDEEARVLTLAQPDLTWMKHGSANIFSASGDQGVITVETSETSLPSEFNLLTFIGNATASSSAASVDSELLVFDNTLTIVMVEAPAYFRSNQIESRLTDNRIFDPITNKILSTREQVLEQRRLMEESTEP